MVRILLSSAILVFFACTGIAQNPVKWSFESKDAGQCRADLVLTGAIQDGWYTYSQFLENEDGPVPTSITFDPGTHFKLLEKPVESGELIKVHDPVFMMTLSKFKHKAVFTQKIEVLDPSKPVTDFITYMVCNDEMCLPPREVPFSISIPTLSGCKAGN